MAVIAAAVLWFVWDRWIVRGSNATNDTHRMAAVRRGRTHESFRITPADRKARTWQGGTGRPVGLVIHRASPDQAAEGQS